MLQERPQSTLIHPDIELQFYILSVGMDQSGFRCAASIHHSKEVDNCWRSELKAMLHKIYIRMTILIPQCENVPR